MAAETPDVGDAQETMPAAFEGEPLEIGFNPEFLKEGIESVEGDEVLLRLISPLRPGPAAAGRGRRLPLPGDADPAQRLMVAPGERPCSSPRSKRGRCAASTGSGSSSTPGIVSVVGPNGAGKTNLVEALYFALTGRSFRTSDRRDLIPFGGSLARAEATVRDEDGLERRLLASVSRSEGRRHLLDGSPADPATLARNRPPVAVFAPDRLTPGQGPAGGAPRPPRRLRRRPLAGAGGAAQALRPGAGAAQRAALAARRAATARRRTCESGTRAWPRPPRRWSRRAAEAVAELAGPFAAAAAELGLEGGATLEYAPRAAGSAEEIRAGLEERREQDIRLGRSSWGPHLDELKLDRGGRSLRRYGSQGQQRAALLALLFAEREALLAARRVTPLLLLDDVMSELDPGRRERLVAPPRRRRPGADHRRRRGVGAAAARWARWCGCRPRRPKAPPHEPPPRPPPGRRAPSRRRCERAAPKTPPGGGPGGLGGGRRRAAGGGRARRSPSATER